MTPVQEMCNAVTMFLPTMVFCYHTIHHWPHPWLVSLLLGSLIHLPASVSYHLLSAFEGKERHVNLRRLDQTMIHISGTLFAFALSKGSMFYTTIHLCYAACAVQRIWRHRRERHWGRVAVSVFIWLWPMIGRWEYVFTAVSFYVGGVCFIPWVNKLCLSGWGHTLFHVGVALAARGMCVFLINTAR